MLNAYIPMVFNNIGFAYFVFALVDAAGAYAHLVSYVITAVAGNVIVNGGCVLIIFAISSYFNKTKKDELTIQEG